MTHPISYRTEMTKDGQYRLIIRYSTGHEAPFGIWPSEDVALSKLRHVFPWCQCCDKPSLLCDCLGPVLMEEQP